MFKRTRMFGSVLLAIALCGCANTNPLPTLAAATAATSNPNAGGNGAPPVANEASKVLAAIAIERVTGQAAMAVRLDGDR
jgi:hypothetical protein